jgi:dihydrofolate synthase/folylpolyglutamate synthase
MMAEVSYEGTPYYKNLRLDLTGLYQLKNLCTVLAALDVLKDDFELTEANIRKGLRTVRKSTGFAGRWQVIGQEPTVVCDTGHNQDGWAQVMPMINRSSHRNLHMVIGTVDDKDITPLFEMLPKTAAYYFCKADIPRGLDPSVLEAKAREHGLKGKVFASVAEALKNARHEAHGDDLVFVGGSTFTVAEVV